MFQTVQFTPGLVLYDNNDTFVLVNVLGCAVIVLDCAVNSRVGSI